MSEDFISGLQGDLVEAMDRYERRDPRSRIATRRYPRLTRPAAPMRVAAAAAIIVALVAVVATVAREPDVERPAAPPGKKLVATDVERGVRFSLDERVLTVQLLPNRLNTIETVSGAQTSATCGTNVTAPTGDPRSETTLTRRWPDGQTSLSYRFPRDVSNWCLLRDQSGSIIAFAGFPGASPGARGPIAETAIKWARLVAASSQICNAYTVCEQAKCQRAGGKPHPYCEPISLEGAVTLISATVQATAISGDRAAAALTNGFVLQLRRTATDEWLITEIGPGGMPAELRRKLGTLTG